MRGGNRPIQSRGGERLPPSPCRRCSQFPLPVAPPWSNRPFRSEAGVCPEAGKSSNHTMMPVISPGDSFQTRGVMQTLIPSIIQLFFLPHLTSQYSQKTSRDFSFLLTPLCPQYKLNGSSFFYKAISRQEGSVNYDVNRKNKTTFDKEDELFHSRSGMCISSKQIN